MKADFTLNAQANKGPADISSAPSCPLGVDGVGTDPGQGVKPTAWIDTSHFYVGWECGIVARIENAKQRVVQSIRDSIARASVCSGVSEIYNSDISC